MITIVYNAIKRVIHFYLTYFSHIGTRTLTIMSHKGSTMEKRDIHQEVTNKLVAMIEAGTLPWRRDWKNKHGTSGMPANIATGKTYNGINVVLLWAEAQAKGYTSSQWGTYKQIQSMGGSVRKGSKATLVVFYKPLKVEDIKTGKDKTIPLLRHFNVFNADQCEGLSQPSPLAPSEPSAPTNILQVAEDFIANTKAVTRFNGGTAYYSPLNDYIGMPSKDLFASSEGYYATFIHELTHWTGHKSRLDRLASHGRFGSESYAFEELVAELGSAFTCAELGINAPVENHASYLASWLKVLKDDKKAIFTASAQASKACQYLKTVGEA